jgi:hypothetical protein
MTTPIPEPRPRTLVGSHPNRKPLEGREAVERALRFCRCRPWKCRAANGRDLNRTNAAINRRGWSAGTSDPRSWLGIASELSAERLDALLDNGFVLHEGHLLHLEGDALVSTELELSPDEPTPNSLEMPDGSHP